MKGVAILTVVLGHIGIGYYNAGVYPDKRMVFYAVYNIIYAFHMPLFMSLSGYVYYTAYYNEKGCPDKKRILRQMGNLAAVYFLFGIPMGLVKVLAGQLANEGTTLLDVVLIPIKPLAPYWYLYSLLFLYLIFSASWLTDTRRRTVAGSIVVVAAICGSIIKIPWFSLSNTLYYSFFFYIGIVRKKYTDSIIENKATGSLLAGISVIIIVMLWDGKQVVSSYKVINLIVALGIILIIWHVFETNGYFGNNRFLRKCGEYCLEIYVIHHTLAAGFRAVLPRIGISNAYVSILLNMLLSTSIPIVFAVFCKKTGIHGLLFHPFTLIAGRNGKSMDSDN